MRNEKNALIKNHVYEHFPWFRKDDALIIRRTAYQHQKSIVNQNLDLKRTNSDNRFRADNLPRNIRKKIKASQVL